MGTTHLGHTPSREHGPPQIDTSMLRRELPVRPCLPLPPRQVNGLVRIRSWNNIRGPETKLGEEESRQQRARRTEPGSPRCQEAAPVPGQESGRALKNRRQRPHCRSEEEGKKDNEDQRRPGGGGCRKQSAPFFFSFDLFKSGGSFAARVRKAEKTFLPGVQRKTGLPTLVKRSRAAS